MAKHIPRSRRQAVLTSLLAELVGSIAQPGQLAAAIKSRFGHAATAPGASDSDVEWRIRWPAGHALAGREFFTLDIETAKTRVLEGAMVEPLRAAFLRGTDLHLPGQGGGDAELVRRPATASIAIEVLPDGRVGMSSTRGGRPDSLYAPLADAVVPRELEKLLAELREWLSLHPSTEAAPMAESPRQAEISADTVTSNFSGDGLQSAREMALPVPVVYRAVRLVAAERDWLISLQAAGVISESQLARLAVLQGLLCRPEEEGLPTPVVRTVGQTPLGHAHLQCRGHAGAPGKGGSSS